MGSTLSITREGSPKQFIYRDERGRKLTDPDQLSRIRSLVIPPAWKDVRIAASPHAKLQAKGLDARGRVQYRYHPSFREKQERQKFSRMPNFSKLLPLIRRKAKADLRQPGLPQTKVLAAIVLILDQTYLRIGSDEYARSNRSYGLTTLQDRHARAGRRKVTFSFKGKSNITHEIDLHDPALIRVVRACRDLPGSDLFQYRDEHGSVCDVKAHHVNAYLKSLTGHVVTAKDFRTYAGTALACALLQKCETRASQTATKRALAQVVRHVARHLGNTPAVCRKSYISPQIIQAFLSGSLTPAVVNRHTSALTRKHLQQVLSPIKAA